MICHFDNGNREKVGTWSPEASKQKESEILRSLGKKSSLVKSESDNSIYQHWQHSVGFNFGCLWDADRCLLGEKDPCRGIAWAWERSNTLFRKPLQRWCWNSGKRWGRERMLDGMQKNRQVLVAEEAVPGTQVYTRPASPSHRFAALYPRVFVSPTVALLGAFYIQFQQRACLMTSHLKQNRVFYQCEINHMSRSTVCRETLWRTLFFHYNVTTAKVVPLLHKSSHTKSTHHLGAFHKCSFKTWKETYLDLWYDAGCKFWE